MKIIVAGGRDFTDYQLLKDKLKALIRELETNDIEIVSGCARGADTWGSVFAKLHGHNVTEFPADWNKHGKKAGYLRNKEMAEYADILVAFWDGESKGTKHMIDLALKHKLETHIFIYETT